MKSSLWLSMMLLSTTLGMTAEKPGPFRVIATPSGCAIAFDNAGDDYRLERLVEGGIIVQLYKASLPAEERTGADGCPGGYRVSAAGDGQGSTIVMRPVGYEFSALIRAGDTLKVVFEKVTDISGVSASQIDQSYRVGVGDQLAITVYGNEDLSNKKYIVGADGTIDYPLLGNVKVAGRNLREVQTDLTAALGKDFLVNPQVTVEMATYKSQFVFVTGAVKTPGKVALQGDTTLKDALSEAGGLTSDAGYRIHLARVVKGPDGIARDPEMTSYSRKDIESGLANVLLRPEDVVTVAEKDFFYIQGEVHRPGKYELRPGLTLMQAIAVAEGLTDWADRKEIQLFRRVGDQGKRKYSLKDIEKEKQPDVPLAPEDTIIISRRIL